MDEEEVDDFIHELKKVFPYVRIQGTDDAIALALKSVRKYNGPKWFGPIGSGTFYGDMDQSIWLSDTSPGEAVSVLRVRLGEKATEGLENFWSSE